MPARPPSQSDLASSSLGASPAARRHVPPRALVLSVVALAVPVAGALFAPESLGEYAAMLWLLALVPAFLLAYYRGWRGVSVALLAGMVALALTEVISGVSGRAVYDSPLLLLVVTAYLAISLGVGWLSEALYDLHRRRRQEETRRQLQKALETMQIGVTVTDPQGKIVYCNPADARQHGYTADELIGKDVGVYATGGSRSPLAHHQLKAWTSWKRESVNRRKDGSTFPVYLRSDVVLGVDGDPIAVITTCEDFTERKAAEGALEQAYGDLRKSHAELQLAQLKLIETEKLESVGRLAAGVAHEVKNPLMTILTGVKYLRMRLGDDEEQLAGLLNDMRSAVQRADTVIRGLLDFSTPRALELAPGDLNAIVERSLRLVKHDFDRARVTAHRELANELPQLQLDAFKMQQVLINVLTNAAHATSAGGTVTVRTFARERLLVGAVPEDAAPQAFGSGQYVVILQVDDTGAGIPADKLSKVFDPFFTTKPTGQGTGLGLAVTRQIVEMHGGTIDIQNRSEGGARVTITLEPAPKPDTEVERHDEEAYPRR